MMLVHHSNAECFSFAGIPVLLTSGINSKEKILSLCALCVFSEAGGEIHNSNKEHACIAWLRPSFTVGRFTVLIN
jgi:hypothetical protein